MKLVKFLIIAALFFTQFLMSPFNANVYAEWGNQIIDGMTKYAPENLPRMSNENDTPESMTLRLATVIIDIIIYISGTLAVIGVIVWGARYMFSFGGDGKEGAKTTIIWSLLGLVAVMLSYAIVHNVIRIFLQVSGG